MFIIKTYNIVVLILFFVLIIYGLFFQKGKRREWWAAISLTLGGVYLLGYVVRFIGDAYEKSSLPNWALTITFLSIFIFASFAVEKGYNKLKNSIKD